MDKILDVKPKQYKYAIGDYVRIKDIDVLKASSGMCNYAGEEAYITDVVYDYTSEAYNYKLNIDSGIHYWTEDMFTFMWAKRAYIKGDFVKVRKDLKVGKPYGNLSFCDGMQYYAGYPTIVNKVTEEGNYVLADCEDWIFSADMLEMSSWYEFAYRDEVKIQSNGVSANQEHYKKSAMQPIEVMQRIFTHDQFCGFLMGNYLKYSMRKGLKQGEDSSKDEEKALQYAYWLDLHKQGIMIDPIEHSVPPDYVFKGL